MSKFTTFVSNVFFSVPTFLVPMFGVSREQVTLGDNMWHLFCWNCIQEHALSSDDEAHCPHCRAVFEPSQVVPLLNL
ncbi:hypothetical protein COOONC_03220 [Cooperia oncophora]